MQAFSRPNKCSREDDRHRRNRVTTAVRRPFEMADLSILYSMAADVLSNFDHVSNKCRRDLSSGRAIKLAWVFRNHSKAAKVIQLWNETRTGVLV